MKTTASLNAYAEAKTTAKTKEDIIFNLIQGLTRHGATKKELEIALSMRHQTVTGRLSSLRDQGRIFMKEEIPLKDGCTVWFATPAHLVQETAAKYHEQKFLKWIAQGKKNFGLSQENAGLIALEFNQNNYFPNLEGEI
jgi:hypothetical protein